SRSATSSNRGSRRWSRSPPRCTTTFARLSHGDRRKTCERAASALEALRGLALHQIGDGFGDRFERLFGRFRAERDGFLGAVKVEQIDASKLWTDQHVGRIAGEAGARNAVLHDLKGLNHHCRQTGPARRPEELALDHPLGLAAQAAL